MNGPTVYGGPGCNSDSIPAPDPSRLSPRAYEEAIVVLQRGDCLPGQKAQAAKQAGYDAVLIFDQHSSDGSVQDDPSCGAGGFAEDVKIVAVCTGHLSGHLLFNLSTEEPTVGRLGERIKVVAPSPVPTCSDPSMTVPYRGSVTFELPCGNPAGEPMTHALAPLPSGGTLSTFDRTAGRVTYTNMAASRARFPARSASFGKSARTYAECSGLPGCRTPAPFEPSATEHKSGSPGIRVAAHA